jgi:GNAT superfamily N-acetyltransferase
LLHYGTGPEVGIHYQGAADIAWFLAWPECQEAAVALLAAAQQQMTDWRATHSYAWDSCLPVPLIGGVPEAWPHIAELLRTAGYRPVREEALYGGWLPDMSQAIEAPLEGIRVQRRVKSFTGGVAFVAVLDEQEIGCCDCVVDLTDGNERPSLRGWAELAEMTVEEGWRNRGVGRWLVQHAVRWCRLAGCDRIALNVAQEDEAAGAGRFYRRFGWEPWARLQVGWRL